jgi:hypothetical protein
MRTASLGGAVVSLLAVITLVAGGRLDTSGFQDFALRVEPLVSPAAANSSQPHLSVSRHGALLSWIERDGPRATLKFAERTPTDWSTPQTVASGTDWFVNWADVPSVIKLADGTLAAHWLQKSAPGTYAYDVRLSYSKDGGRTWSASFLPHHDGTKTEHGFAALFEMPGSGLGAIWLDGRTMPAEGHAPAAGGGHGAITVRFGAFDRNWKQTADVPVDLRVCECCPTTAAVTADGPIVAYRDRTQDEIRDIVVSRLENGKWTEPKAVFADGWHIAGCPVNGPMLAARGRRVAVAWFTGTQNQNRVFVAFSDDAGRTFGAPVRVDDRGALGRVDIELLDDGDAVVSWIEYADRVAELRVRRVAPSGAKSAAVTVESITSERSNGYPRIARFGNELVMAWTESVAAPAAGGGPQLRVRTAIGRLR